MAANHIQKKNPANFLSSMQHAVATIIKHKVEFMYFCNRCDRLVTQCFVLVKGHFLLLHLCLFFHNLFLQTPQWCHIIFAIDGSSFLKVIDEENILCIPKYGNQKIACWYLHLWSLWPAFTCCCPFSWLPIWLQSEVVDPCFIHCHMQKPLLHLWRWHVFRLFQWICVRILQYYILHKYNTKLYNRIKGME